MVIKKVSSGYRLYSRRTHRNLGTYRTKEEALKREKQIQYFKTL